MSDSAIENFRPLYERLVRPYRIRKSAYPEILEDRRGLRYNWRPQKLPALFRDTPGDVLEVYIEDSFELVHFASFYSSEVLESTGIAHCIRELLFIIRAADKRARRWYVENSQPAQDSEDETELASKPLDMTYVEQFDAYMARA